MKNINSYTELLNKYKGKSSIKNFCPLLDNKLIDMYLFEKEYISKPQFINNEIVFLVYNSEEKFWYDDMFVFEDVKDIFSIN